MLDESTYCDKGREEAAGARSHLGPVPFGPSLRLLAAQHRLGDALHIARAGVGRRYICSVDAALGHTGYR